MPGSVGKISRNAHVESFYDLLDHERDVVGLQSTAWSYHNEDGANESLLGQPAYAKVKALEQSLESEKKKLLSIEVRSPTSAILLL